MNKTYTYRLARKEEAAEIHNLMELVYQEVADKDTFVCDDLSYVEKHIEERGFILVALEAAKGMCESGVGENHEERIVACLIVDFPMESVENLGRDIGLSEDKLDQVVHMDSAVVHPEHRGVGLQGKLLAFAESHVMETLDRRNLQDDGEVQASNRPLYLLATVSPFNPASYKTLEKLGYRLVCTKEKYGGLQRRIYCKYCW